MLWRQFPTCGGQVKHVDGGLPFPLFDQSDIDIAFLLGKNRADLVEKSRLVLRNNLDERAVRRAFVIELNLRRLDFFRRADLFPSPGAREAFV